MRIQVSPGTVSLAREIDGEVVRVIFDASGEAEVPDNVGRALCKQLKGVNKIQPTQEVEEE
jgi:hypothetical protein